MVSKVITKTKTKARHSLNRYAGEWVAFVDGGVVAHNKILAGLMREVEGKNIKSKASVFRVPRKDEGPYVLASA